MFTNQHTVIYRVGRDPAEVSYAREQARKTLPFWGLDEYRYLIEVLLSELVTNAVHYGDGEIEVCLSCGCDCLRIEVHDDGCERPVLRHPTAEDIGGRGLALIDGLVEQHGGAWGVTDDAAGPGKTVFAAMRLPLGSD